MFGADLGGVVAVAGQIIAAAAAAIAVWQGIVYFFLNKIRVIRLTNPDCAELRELYELHERKFKGHILDEFQELRRWIGEANDKNSIVVDMIFAAKHMTDVVGYLFATYYRGTPYLFISYIAIDDDNKVAKKSACFELIKELYDYTKRRHYHWEAILSEVEEFKIKTKNSKEIEDKFHARGMLQIFHGHISELSKKCQVHLAVFHILCDYRQPALRPEDIAQYYGADPRDYRQWLFYIPKNNYGVEGDGNGLFLSRETVAAIGKFIYNNVYHDAFRDNIAYEEYLKNMELAFESRLTNRIAITTDSRRNE